MACQLFHSNITHSLSYRTYRECGRYYLLFRAFYSPCQFLGPISASRLTVLDQQSYHHRCGGQAGNLPHFKGRAIARPVRRLLPVRKYGRASYTGVIRADAPQDRYILRHQWT